MTMQFSKYEKFKSINMPNRTWPSKTIEEAPIWCSVDLRDANQALPIPMNVDEKIEMFKLLVDIGFKEIEVGFPSASETEFNFVRRLIEEKLIPEDVTIQVLTQLRNPLIEKTFEALEGAKRAVVHVYNSTSTLQRRVVFEKSKEEIIDIAVKGTKFVKQCAEKNKETEFVLEYSPESFTGTELDFAKQICDSVIDIWKPTPERKMIINLPATVEMSTPNVFADQIEWMCKNLNNRESLTVSVHAHNDRGCAIAASEFGIMAGADRLEGTLFGNGERTGNADIITLAMNLYSQGINPQLDFSNINYIKEVYEKNMKMPVHQRHPYSGELVFAAFSGSHQDAIRKGLNILKMHNTEKWEVPYLPIDPQDVGREYQEVIRINSQSGKGGVAYILESDFGYQLPKAMHPEFGNIIKDTTDRLGREISSKEIFEIFKETYLNIKGQIELGKVNVNSQNGNSIVNTKIKIDSDYYDINGNGNGPISAFVNGLKNIGIDKIDFESYEEHALSKGENAEAVSYIQLRDKDEVYFGVGVDTNTTTSSFKAIICALNRYYSLNKQRKIKVENLIER